MRRSGPIAPSGALPAAEPRAPEKFVRWVLDSVGANNSGLHLRYRGSKLLQT